MFKDKEYEESIRFSASKSVNGAKSSNVKGFSGPPPELCDPCISLHSGRIAPFRFKDAIKTGKTIIAEEGIKGLFKGAFPRIISLAPASAISWTTYELMKNWLAGSKSFTH